MLDVVTSITKRNVGAAAKIMAPPRRRTAKFRGVCSLAAAAAKSTRRSYFA
jgi:hypothetical protein